MTGPTFSDGKGFGRRASPWFVASLIGLPALFIGFTIIGDPDYTLQGLMALALGGLWMLLTFGNGIHIAGMGRQEIHPRDENREVRHTVTCETDGHEHDYYGSLTDAQIKEIEEIAAEIYAAEMREYGKNR